MNHADFDALCLSWAGVTVDLKWRGADRVYSVASKMFLLMPEGEKRVAKIYFKVPDDLFLALTDQPGIVPAPYLARAKWILIQDVTRHDPEWVKAQIRRSYELVRAKLPKALRNSLLDDAL